MKKHYLFLSLFGILLSSLAFGQQTISGNVTDADTNDPLLGVTVLIKGTNLGTVTDFDGNYVLPKMASGDYTLELTYTGYAKKTVTVSVGSSDVTTNVELEFSASQLDEIIVTGTGAPVARKKIGNSIGSISASKLEDLPINSFSDMLQGREPGIVGFPSGGLTGEGAQIRIRGNASLSQLNEPIIIIDGIRVDRGGGFGGGFVGSGGGGSTSRLDDINPESVERIEILKGASAATLFGTEASNGVIQIFTKKGVVGSPKFDFKVTKGFINFPKGKFPNNTGFTTSADRAAELSEFYGYNIKPYQLISTNATEDLFEQGHQTTFNGTVSGGTEFITYFASGRYTNTDGPFGGKDRPYYPEGVETLATDMDKMAQLNINLNINPSKKVNIRFTSGYTSRFASTSENNNNIYGVGSLAQFSKPELAKATNSTGTIAFATVDEVLQIAIESKIKHYNGSIGINYYPTDWLKIDGVFGLDHSSQSSSNFLPFGWNINGFSGNQPQGELNVATRDYLAQSGELKFSLTHQFGSISSNFLIGGQYVKQETQQFSGRGRNFPGPGFEVTSAAAEQSLSEFFEEVINTGAFIQEQLGFKELFFLTLGLRMDAHSAFGSNFNAALYPKVSMSYIPSESDKWSNIGPISSLQLRSSYGWAGLQPGAFDALTTYEALASATGAGIAPNNLGNPNLKPEISKEWEAGFTAGLFDDKINFEFTYWDRITEDALIARQFPLTGGFRDRQLTNIGELKAHGMELNLNGTLVRTSDLTVTAFINGAYLQEKVTSLGGAPRIKVGGSYPRYRNFIEEGYAPGMNLGAALMDVSANQLPIDIAVVDGQPDTREQLLSYFTANPDASYSMPTQIGKGSVLLKDEDGDGDYLDHVLGKPTPDWTGAIGGSISWKNFTLNTTFEFKAGNYYVNNLTDAFRQANGAIGRNLPTSAKVVRDYTTGGVDANFNPQKNPQVRLDALEDWLYENLALAPFSGLNTIERADFMRWRELSVVYRFPSTVLKQLGLSSGSLGVSGKNIALFTRYSGVDPEMNYVGRGSGSDLDRNFGQGVAAFGWPIPRQVILTLKAGL